MLHGPYGEDGTIQGLFELADVPYVGAGVLASAVGMDKAVMKSVFQAHGLPIVEHLVVTRHEWRHAPERVSAVVLSASKAAPDPPERKLFRDRLIEELRTGGPPRARPAGRDRGSGSGRRRSRRQP